MIKLYTNRELSELLGVNLAKWKRWSREFLPPDPLGGMQSGFARQYYFRDAFHVMLGGHLVGDLHFSVYNARRIMEDLNGWLSERGFYQRPGKKTDSKNEEIRISEYKIFIQHFSEGTKKEIEFSYTIRGIMFNKPLLNSSTDIREERYVEEVTPSKHTKKSETKLMYEKIINISSLYNNFVKKIGCN